MAHDRRQLILERLHRELVERVLPLADRAVLPLSVEAGPVPDHLAPFAVGAPWGAPWATTWFRLTGDVPRDWTGRGPVEVAVDLGFELDLPGFQCEGLVRDAEGRAVQGIHPRRTRVPLRGDAAAGPVDVLIEAASNPHFPQYLPSPLGSVDTAGDEPLYVLRRADLVLVDPDAVELLHDLSVLDDLVRSLDRAEPRAVRLLAVLERALDAVPDVAAARRLLEPALAVPARAGHRVVATGHAHIDTAWLWPIRETIRKCVRSFTSAVDLMDDDPSFVFSCSSAQQYAWVKEHEPATYERIRAHVAGGQFIPVGGMWVEADMNLPSGESLARQIVVGQRFFEAELGMRCTEVWIPDVFGYPAGLPQLFAAGGMRRFVTQKLSWNRTNRFPHHTFWWEGLDGSRALTHFPPVDNYGAEVWPHELVGSVQRFRDHAWSDWSLVPYGYGDGGGGPTREMLARAHRMADLDGVPPVELGSVATFFDHVEAEIDAGAEVPVWRGELYFETHRGTLTSQLGTKLGNRRCERLLREAELWAVTAGDRDAAQFDRWWHEVLTQQFHDILPGSSIAWVHDDAEATFARVADELEAAITERLTGLAGTGSIVANATALDRDEVVIVGPQPTGVPVVSAGANASMTVTELMLAATVAASSPRSDHPGRGFGPDHQELADGRVAINVSVPAMSIAPVTPRPVRDRVVVTDRSMANSHLALAWNRDGAITSIIDVARGREVLPAGSATAFELAVDQPIHYDAWDLESWVRRDPTVLGDPASVTVIAEGPLVGEVRVVYELAPSTLTVTYRLRAGSPRLDIEVDLDWHHREHLLSWALPVDVWAETATCGVQFGAVRRPTHESTSWDAAKFEVCAHRYSDVSEPDFGVALLDDGRYGRCLFGGAMRVSLAKAACYPDPFADEGRHLVSLAVYPHGPGQADVVAEAERFNVPLRLAAGSESVSSASSALSAAPGGGSPGSVSRHTSTVALVRDTEPGARSEPGPRPAPDPIPAATIGPVVTVTGRGIEIDAVKAANDGSGDVIVRLHEACGNRAQVTVACDRRIRAASACNLLEEPEQHFEVSDGIVSLTIPPYGLRTLRMQRDPQ